MAAEIMQVDLNEKRKTAENKKCRSYGFEQNSSKKTQVRRSRREKALVYKHRKQKKVLCSRGCTLLMPQRKFQRGHTDNHTVI